MGEAVTCIEVRPVRAAVVGTDGAPDADRAPTSAVPGGLLVRGPCVTVSRTFSAHSLVACVMDDGTCRVCVLGGRANALFGGATVSVGAGNVADCHPDPTNGGVGAEAGGVRAWVVLDLAHRHMQCKAPAVTLNPALFHAVAAPFVPARSSTHTHQPPRSAPAEGL